MGDRPVLRRLVDTEDRLSRVGQVFKWPRGTFALVTSDPAMPRRRGSTVGAYGGKQDPDLPVHTMAIWDDSGTIWYPVERLERTLASWELEGRRLA